LESSSNLSFVPPKLQALDSLLVAHRFTNVELEYLEEFADTVIGTRHASIYIVALCSAFTACRVVINFASA